MWRHGRAADHVAEDHEDRAAEKRYRDQAAVLRSGQHAHDMRDDQADKSDDPADRYTGGHQKRSCDYGDGTGPFYGYTHALRFVIPKAQKVEISSEKEEADDGAHQHDPHKTDLDPGRGGETAEHPQIDLLELFMVPHHQERDRRCKHRGTGNSRQQDACHGPRSRDPGHSEYQEHRKHGPGKSKKPDAAYTGYGKCDAEGDRDRGSESRAGRDAEHLRIRKRISEKRLHHDTCCGKSTSDKSCQQDSRETNIPYDQFVRTGDPVKKRFLIYERKSRRDDPRAL